MSKNSAVLNLKGVTTADDWSIPTLAELAEEEPNSIMDGPFALNSPIMKRQGKMIVHGVGRPRLDLDEMPSRRNFES